MAEIMEDKLATKEDIKNLEAQIKTLEIATSQDFKILEEKFSHAITQAKSELTIRMGTMFAASIAILTAIQKLT